MPWVRAFIRSSAHSPQNSKILNAEKGLLKSFVFATSKLHPLLFNLFFVTILKEKLRQKTSFAATFAQRPVAGHRSPFFDLIDFRRKKTGLYLPKHGRLAAFFCQLASSSALSLRYILRCTQLLKGCRLSTYFVFVKCPAGKL